MRLPDGASLERNEARRPDRSKTILLSIPGVEDVTTFGGLDYHHAAPTTRTSPRSSRMLKPWEERKARRPAVRRHSGPGAARGSARCRARSPSASACRRFSASAPRRFRVHGRGSHRRRRRRNSRRRTQTLIAGRAAATRASACRQHVPRTTVPQYRVDLDTDKAQTLGIPMTDVYDALQTFLGGLYVNDFNRFGRTWRVMMQAEPEYPRPARRHQPLLCAHRERRHGAAEHAGRR